MEQQGAVARYANCGVDDETEQLNGEPSGSQGPSNPSTVPKTNRHYENIYESIEHFSVASGPSSQLNVAAAVVPADEFRRPLFDINNPNYIMSNPRNDHYDRPRPQLTHNGALYNVHRRPRPFGIHQYRSLDDTEQNNNIQFENIYEQIREEPVYRNVLNTHNATTNSNMYGRLDVIGHGVGRIERHLSSSCGNINHYNLGGHYAVLGQSHLGTVGHIRLDTSVTGNCENSAARDSPSLAKGLFSCLGGENSQSMNNIARAVNLDAIQAEENSANNQNTNRATGAIPKVRNQSTRQHIVSQSAENYASLNRISKSSLQWLLVNKWMPLWIDQDEDCKVIDFNFMFSRNCGRCGVHSVESQGMLRFNGSTAHSVYNDCPPPMGELFSTRRRSLRRGLLEEATQSQQKKYSGCLLRRPTQTANTRTIDPFRNWELNVDNNSFRPADGRAPKEVRRITDGTFRRNDSTEKSTKSKFRFMKLGREDSNGAGASQSNPPNDESPTCSRYLPLSSNRVEPNDIDGIIYSDTTEDDRDQMRDENNDHGL